MLKPKIEDLIDDVKTTQWYRLGLELEISQKEMDIIDEDCKRDTKEALKKTFKQWLKTEEPTWRQIIAALRKIGENNCARELEQKYC